MTASQPLPPVGGGVEARRYCPALMAVAGTLRQYWYCSHRAGHEGEHEVIVQGGEVVKRWPNPSR